MESSIEEIKKKADIIEFIGSYITLKKTGRNYKANCPFHNEKTASFVVSQDRQIWHCFGSCGDGGDVIKFLMKWEGITFFEALRELADRYGVSLSKLDFEDKDWQIKQKLIQINTLACDYFEYILHNTKIGEKAREYLESRKINPQAIKKFQLGYAPSSWDSLVSFLHKKKYKDEEIIGTGLIIKGKSGSYYDRFRGRIMFPLKDTKGNIIGFSGRILSSTEKESKYINTPETVLYHKRETLYGIHLAKEAIKKGANALLVEGEFDVISPFEHGIEGVVAIKGSAVTKEQLSLLKRYTPKITLALDMDDAGEEAVKRAIYESEDLDLDIRIAIFEGGKDPDEAVLADQQAFKITIEKADPIYDFLIKYSLKKFPGKDAYSKKKISDEVLPFISKVKNPIVQSYYIKKIAAILEVSEESVIEAIRKGNYFQQKKRTPFKFKKSLNSIERGELLEKYLLSLLFQNDRPYEIADKIFSQIQIDDFVVPALKKISQYFIKFRENNSSEYGSQKFAMFLPQELRTIFDQVYLISSGEWELEGIKLDRLILEVKRNSLKQKIGKLLERENPTNNEEDNELKTLTELLKEVEKRVVSV